MVSNEELHSLQDLLADLIIDQFIESRRTTPLVTTKLFDKKYNEDTNEE